MTTSLMDVLFVTEREREREREREIESARRERWRGRVRGIETTMFTLLFRQVK